jgi:site-specific recombinase XerD
MQTNEQIISRMTVDLNLRGLSSSTRYRYLMSARRFLDWANNPCEETGEEEIRNFLNYLINEIGLGASCVNTYNAALRFLFAVTLDRNLNYRQIPRLKQAQSLPEILSKSEVVRIFDNASTLRNKAVLMTIYGAGLRISEACNLKIRDIDSESMRIFVRCGKNSKDRYSLLSQTNLVILREYWRECRPNHPDGWLFLNKDGSEKIHRRTVQSAFNAAAKRAGINKDVSTHTLRSCFATHLLEGGADIHSIMRLLGHANLRNTSIYLKLASFDPSLKSPLDSLSGGHEENMKEVDTSA